MPKVRHKKEREIEVVLGSVLVQLDEDGIGEVPEEYYKEVASGRLKNWETAEAVRQSSDIDRVPTVESSREVAAATAIERIDTIVSVDKLEEYVREELRKTVIEASDKRKEALAQ